MPSPFQYVVQLRAWTKRLVDGQPRHPSVRYKNASGTVLVTAENGIEVSLEKLQQVAAASVDAVRDGVQRSMHGKALPHVLPELLKAEDLLNKKPGWSAVEGLNEERTAGGKLAGGQELLTVFLTDPYLRGERDTSRSVSAGGLIRRFRFRRS